MKNLIFISTVLTLSFLIQSCGGSGKEKIQIIPQGQVVQDLSPMGFSLCMNVPDSTTGYAEMTQNAGGIEIRVGNKFDVLVNVAGTEEMNMEQQKALAGASVDAATINFTTDTDTLLIWETKFGDLPAQIHFYRLIKVENDTYYVRDNNQNTENQFSMAEIRRMVEMSRSLRLKPKEEKKSE
jgi:hypothetical protein